MNGIVLLGRDLFSHENEFFFFFPKTCLSEGLGRPWAPSRDLAWVSQALRKGLSPAEAPPPGQRHLTGQRRATSPCPPACPATDLMTLM